jgi:hypothetical protein
LSGNRKLPTACQCQKLTRGHPSVAVAPTTTPAPPAPAISPGQHAQSANISSSTTTRATKKKSGTIITNFHPAVARSQQRKIRPTHNGRDECFFCPSEKGRAPFFFLMLCYFYFYFRLPFAVPHTVLPVSLGNMPAHFVTTCASARTHETISPSPALFLNPLSHIPCPCFATQAASKVYMPPRQRADMWTPLCTCAPCTASPYL